MTRVELPNLLKGPWHHLLILTYGADIPFFENALWRILDSRCQNKIILADGRRYLEACANYARSGLPRHMNQQYVAEGIFTNQAAHAKIILLTNPEQGRLLVGSGNLGMQGYVSGGEVFATYEYSTESPQAISAFLAARELAEHLIARRYVSAPAERRLNHLLENTPWLFQSTQSDWRPVRHNLTTCFLDQLQQMVDGERVEDLWVLSPFYDQDAVALQRMLSALQPQKTTLLVQPGRTSVDGAALDSVLQAYGWPVQIQPFEMGEDNPYVHAKVYLLKLADRAVCLQGSPNLSQVAMLLTVPQGNVEVANLLVGKRDAFDYLFSDLTFLPPAANSADLGLSIDTAEEEVLDGSAAWRLKSAEWYQNRLCLAIGGSLPRDGTITVIIADHELAPEIRQRDTSWLELQLPAEADTLLTRPVPVTICIHQAGARIVSNPVFPCNRTALDAAIEVADETEKLDRIGGLDLEDDEFEQLLGELEAALIIDRQSVWQMAGRNPPSTAIESDDDALRLDYLDVDYDLLRQHPRIQQYLEGATGGQRYARTRLQIILNSITDHFQGLLDPRPVDQITKPSSADLDEEQAETEEEREEEEREKQRRRQSTNRRVNRLLRASFAAT